MIDAKNIIFSYGNRMIWNSANLKAEDGEFVAILGGNGAGKSTLIKILSGNLHASSGNICYGKCDIEKMSPKQLAKIRAVLDQEDTLDFDYTVEQVVRLGGYARGDSINDESVLKESLISTGLENFEGRYYTQLSGGEKRRVMIARAIFQIGGMKSAGGKNLLLDEPSAGLDPARAHEAMRSAKKMAENGCAVIAVLHDPNLAAEYADKIGLVKDGKFLAFGATEEILTAQNLSNAYEAKCEIIHRADKTGNFVYFPR